MFAEVEGSAWNACAWLVDRHLQAGGGDRIAYSCQGRSITYAELAHEVARYANGLATLGVGPGQRVLMVVDDEPAFVFAFLASLRIGAVAVPVSTMLRPAEIAPLVADCEAQVLVCSDRYAGAIDSMTRGSGVGVAVVTGEATPAASVEIVSAKGWTDASDIAPAATQRQSQALWLYTSGTTGTPKAAMHRHGDIEAVCDTYAATVLRAGPEDVFYSVPKLFFAFGLGNGLLFPLSVGAQALIDPDPPTPARVAAVAAEGRPTLFFAPPGFCAAMVDSEVDSKVLGDARHTVTAGEVLPAEVLRRFEGRFGTEMLDGIGSTEALHIFCSNHPGRVRPGTSGEPVAGWELQLRAEDGSVVEQPDQPGALWVRGPATASGYWKREELSAQTFVDGWMRTGDVYIRSSDNYWQFVGRNSDMIKSGGIWVSPAEVESVLLEHPAVREAAVVGTRNSLGLETTVAFVVARRGQDLDTTELLEHCRSRMAAFKRPREIVVVEELPRTATGKVKRFELRSALAAEGHS